MIETTFQMPSMGIFPGTLAEMTLREMTVKEEKALFTSKQPFVKMQGLLTSTFISGRDKKGEEVGAVNTSLWPIVDMNHALLKLRLVTVGREYDFTTQCPVCDRAIQYGVDLEDLQTTYAIDGQTTLVYDVKTSFGLVKMRHMLVKDQNVLDRAIRQRRAKQGRNFDGGYSLRLAAQIAGHDSEEFGNILQAESWLENLTSRQREEIDMSMEEHIFGDDLSIEIDCPDCKSIREVGMPITRDFLFRRSSRRG